jgi:hypothetical protein
MQQYSITADCSKVADMAAMGLRLLSVVHEITLVLRPLQIDAYATQRTLRPVDSTLLMCAAELQLHRASLKHSCCSRKYFLVISFECRLFSPLFQLVSLHGPPGVVPGV